MIAECLERMRQGACGGCEREEACGSMLRRFGVELRRPASAATPDRPRRPSGNMFAMILREIGRAIEARMPPPPSAFQQEAERRLEPLLAGGNVRMEALARALGCSRQTLYRRLKAEGLTFEALLNRLRRRLAIKFLTEEGVSVKEAAYRLGFADPAAFSRAFKRWTGSAPRSVRAGKGRPAGSGPRPPRAPARPTAG